MRKLLLAAIAVLALLFGPLVYNEYTLNEKIGGIQKFVDSTDLPFKVFRPPTASVSEITNYTKVQMAITDDGIVYYYGKSEYKPDLIEKNSLIIVQHAYIENASESGFTTEKNGQKYYYLPMGGFRSLSHYRNTSYPYATEIIIMHAGEKKPIDLSGEEAEYSKKMIVIAESMR